MTKYRVLARTVVFKVVGEYEANNPSEAIGMAVEEGDSELTLCYHCDKEVSGIEFETYIVEEK